MVLLTYIAGTYCENGKMFGKLFHKDIFILQEALCSYFWNKTLLASVVNGVPVE